MEIEQWRKVWRNGFAPIIGTTTLEALRDALKADDPRLTQGGTTTPSPLMCVEDWPCEAGCALGYMGAVENGGFADVVLSGKCTNPNAATVGQCEEFFARLCFEADQRLGEPAACRWFLNWFDDSPRTQMLGELLFEVERTLDERKAVAA